MTKIKSRVFKRGHALESNAISDYGTGEKGRWHWDKETREFKRGNPPPRVIKYDRAPGIIGDEMPETYCHADGKHYTSKKKMEAAHKALGFEQCHGEPDSSWKADEKDTLPEVTDYVDKAYNLLKNGEAPLTEKEKAQCKIANEVLKQKEK